MKLDVTVLGKALDLAYDKAIEGVPGIPGLASAEELAKDYLDNPGRLEKRGDTLIRYQVAKGLDLGLRDRARGLDYIAGRHPSEPRECPLRAASDGGCDRTHGRPRHPQRPGEDRLLRLPVR